MIFFYTFVLPEESFLTECRPGHARDTDPEWRAMRIVSSLDNHARWCISQLWRPGWELLSSLPERTSAVNNQIPEAVVPEASTRAYIHIRTQTHIYAYLGAHNALDLFHKFSVPPPPPHLSISAIRRLIEAWPFLMFFFLLATLKHRSCTRKLFNYVDLSV